VILVRQRLVLSAAVGGLIAALLLARAPVATAAAPPSPQTYLALGDSLAVGVGAVNPARLGYVAHVFHVARARPAGSVKQLRNLAVSGETSSSFISSGGQLARAVSAINEPSSDIRLVTLDIGGNDFLGLLQPGQPCAGDPSTSTCQIAVGTALAAFQANYTLILSQLTLALSRDPGDERLLVMTYFNPFSGTGNLVFERAFDIVLLGSDGRIDCTALPAADDRLGVNDLIACIGVRFGATTVDIQPLFVGRGPNLTHIDDGDIHPNTAGHAAIAHAFIRVLLHRGD
jgi:acyl-CoA thioesterase I